MAALGEQTLQSLAERIIQLDGIVENENISNRFNELEDTAGFVEGMKNQNTKRKTTSDLNLFSKYLVSVGERRDPIDIDPLELNMLLARFFLNVRKSDGLSEYEPDTLKTYQSSIARYLSEKNYSVNILTDVSFKHSRDVLSAKRKELKAMGKGNKEKKAEPLTREELSILYEKGQRGKGNPNSLINTVWWNNTVHFGLRSRQEHIDMRWGDVELSRTSNGEEYLQFTERATKTRTGATSSTRAFQPKMFALQDSTRCPVAAFKEYRDRRPQDLNTNPDSPFYLSVNQNTNDVWYSRQNMGKNKLGNLMKKMCEEAGICGRKVNHSARKTTVTTLLHGGIAPTQIMQVTGHRNANSINSYSSASIDQQREMSSMLSELSNTRPDNTKTIETDNTFQDDNINDFFSEDIEETLRQIEGFEILNPKPKASHSTTSTCSTTASNTSSLLPRARILGNVTINMNCTIASHNDQPQPKRRRIRVIDSQSDSE